MDAYTPLDPRERDVLEAELANDPDLGERAMGMGLLEKWRKQGLEEGRQEGWQEGQRELLLTLLESQFGTLGDHVRQRVTVLSAAEIAAVSRKLITAKSLADLGLDDPPAATP